MLRRMMEEGNLSDRHVSRMSISDRRAYVMNSLSVKVRTIPRMTNKVVPFFFFFFVSVIWTPHSLHYLLARTDATATFDSSLVV